MKKVINNKNKNLTHAGDNGQTQLANGEQISKCDSFIYACGSMDSALSALGLARAVCNNQKINASIRKTQELLFCAISQFSTMDAKKCEHHINDIDIKIIEEETEKFSDYSDTKFEWQIPGNTTQGAILHLARCSVRQAERDLVKCAKTQNIDKKLIAFFNRLSDYCFTLATYLDNN